MCIREGEGGRGCAIFAEGNQIIGQIESNNTAYEGESGSE
jgi:hypothetical protein